MRGGSAELDDLRFRYAAPEATYLVVYVEAIDVFLAEDVRDIVDRQWGADFLAPGRFGVQERITVHVAANALLDDRKLDSMVAHRSMRIDGPAFRGRPVGHRQALVRGPVLAGLVLGHAARHRVGDPDVQQSLALPAAIDRASTRHRSFGGSGSGGDTVPQNGCADRSRPAGPPKPSPLRCQRSYAVTFRCRKTFDQRGCH